MNLGQFKNLHGCKEETQAVLNIPALAGLKLWYLLFLMIIIIFNLIICLIARGEFCGIMILRLVHYDFQQCIMLHIALGNNVATGYKL